MTKRIAHIIAAGPTEGRTIPEEVISPGFEVDVVPSYAAAFPGDAVDLMVAEVSTVEAAMRAQTLGYDGVLIGAVADYGIDAVRSAVRVPAIGCGQASLLAASAIGHRFGIVTIWPATTGFLYSALVERNSLTGHCSSVRHVTADAELATLADDDNFYTQMRAGQENMVARILEQIEAAVNDDGADTVVLGCNCMTPVATTLAERASVPIIDPTTTGYKFAESLVALGLAQSPAAYVPAQGKRTRLFQELVEVARVEIEGDGSADCDVCAIDGNGACELPAPAAAVS